jgi:glycosyltransferase involved in cell wall biosynthesis
MSVLQSIGRPRPAPRRQLPNRPARILEFRCADGVGGGPEKTILLGAARADRRRYAVTVCYIRNARDTAFDIDRRAARLGLDYVEVRQRGPFDLRVLAAVRRLVRERDIDLVHAHDYKTDLLALVLARQEGIIPLATAHGWTGHTRRERWLYYPLDRRLLARFPRLIAVSGQIRDELVRSGAGPDQVRTILNGIDDTAFVRDPRRRRPAREYFGLTDDELAIGAVGRLAPQKRFDVLLRAFARLRQQRPEARLLVAGAGELHEALAAEARRQGLGAACRFVGHVGDVRAFHHALDALAQSSDYEGTPNAVLEAMALETPVVATAAGGTGELIRHGIDGLLVPRRDPDALAAALEETLADRPGALRRVAAARARVETDLSFDARTRALEAVYDELLHE